MYRIMSSSSNSFIDFQQPVVYQIRLQGLLGPQWEGWFDGLQITFKENDQTVLTGPVADQAALYGLLRKVRDLGLPLVSVMLLRRHSGGRRP